MDLSVFFFGEYFFLELVFFVLSVFIRKFLFGFFIGSWLGWKIIVYYLKEVKFEKKVRFSLVTFES